MAFKIILYLHEILAWQIILTDRWTFEIWLQNLSKNLFKLFLDKI